MKQNSIAAVIVTFNRLELLKRCVSAIMNQSLLVDQIILVNNGSTDGTFEWLQTLEQDFFKVINQNNCGSAGGMYTGILTAYNIGFEWIWCMDDDGLPDNEALQQLFSLSFKKPCMMNSLVLDINDKSRLAFPILGTNNANDCNSSTIPNITHLFNGTFIHRDIVSTVGLPNKELFIWGDESEYFFRVKKVFPCFTVVNSKHYHPKPTFDWKHNWENNVLFKLRYKIRNQFFVYRRQHNFLIAILKYILFISVIFLLVFLFQKNKFKKICMVYNSILEIRLINF